MVSEPNSIGNTGRPVASNGIGCTNFFLILEEVFLDLTGDLCPVAFLSKYFHFENKCLVESLDLPLDSEDLFLPFLDSTANVVGCVKPDLDKASTSCSVCGSNWHSLCRRNFLSSILIKVFSCTSLISSFKAAFS